jgi:hypothetical protein
MVGSSRAIEITVEVAGKIAKREQLRGDLFGHPRRVICGTTDIGRKNALCRPTIARTVDSCI